MMSGFNSQCRTLSQYVTSHLGQLSLAVPSWLSAVTTSWRTVTPCGWGVKAGMVRVWVAGKTVWSPCYIRAISECFIDRAPPHRHNKAQYKFTYFTLLYFTSWPTIWSSLLIYVTSDCKSVIYVCSFNSSAYLLWLSWFNKMMFCTLFFLTIN